MCQETPSNTKSPIVPEPRDFFSISGSKSSKSIEMVNATYNAGQASLPHLSIACKATYSSHTPFQLSSLAR